ncbi:gamma carbonic anhydrase family protein [bacterium]|nr:gamma carbonic anhydrase family protein [bacterium]
MDTIFSYLGKTPRIDKEAVIFKTAVVIGDVSIGSESTIWFGTVLRGDVNSITIGSQTNIQDNSTIHVTTDLYPTAIGDGVTIGHNVVIHGSTIGDYVLIGMNATILDGCTIEPFSIIAAGSMVKQGTHIPSGVLVAGNPAVIKRELRDDEKQFLRQSAKNYVRYGHNYLTSSADAIYSYDEIMEALKS